MKKPRRNFFAIILCLAIAALPLSAASCHAIAAGDGHHHAWDGTEDISWHDEGKSDFDISTPEQLAGLAKLVNSGVDFAGKTISLKDDIYLNVPSNAREHEWVSIAACKDGDDKAHAFCGTLKGNGHSIYYMYVSGKGKGGLFGRIGASGVVTGVTVARGICNRGGAIAYANEGIIQFCANQSQSGNSDEYANGGICNYNYRLVYGCENLGEVWGSTAGGIVGLNCQKVSTVSQCRNMGVVCGSSRTAGICAANAGWVYDCYCLGTVTDHIEDWGGAREVYGISQNQDGTTENCYFAGMLDAENAWLGFDPIADSDGKVKNCYFVSEQASEAGQKVSEGEMKDAAFVSSLASKEDNLTNAWLADSDHVNQGYPMTSADLQRSQKTYRRLQEIWTPCNNSALKIDGTIGISLQIYFGDVVPVISLSDPSLGDVSYSGNLEEGMIQITSKRTGSGQLILELSETEDICAYRHVWEIEMVKGGEAASPSPSVSPKPSGTGTDLPTATPDHLMPSPSRTPNPTSSVTLPPSGTPSAKPTVSSFPKPTVNPSSVTDVKPWNLSGGKDQVNPAKPGQKTDGTQGNTSDRKSSLSKPAKVKGLKVSRKKRKIIVKWKKVARAKGYQVQYADNGKFKKKKTVRTANNRVVIKKGKGKRMYVRIRAYRGSGRGRVYGSWSGRKWKAV